MSSDPAAGRASAGAPAQDVPGQPSEEELRAAYEAELSRITSTDMMVQAAVSLLNIGGRRLGAPSAPAGAPGAAPPGQGGAGGERDLEQVRDAVDAVRALLDILDRSLGKELAPLRDALSQLQMAYAREVQASGGETGPGAGAGSQDEHDARPGAGSGEGAGDGGSAGAGAPAEQGPETGGKRPGPAESSGRLWVPGR